MSWTYEIADGDTLNKIWRALCELTQQLRLRIIETDGNDTNAPTYTKGDGTTSKQIAFSDFTGYPIRSGKLQDNVDAFRAAIMQLDPGVTCVWCNSDATERYSNITEVLDAGSYGSTWKADGDWHTPDYWAQMFEAMETLRYIFFYMDEGGGGSATAEYGGLGGPRTGATAAAAWSAVSSSYVTGTLDNSSQAAELSMQVQGRLISGTTYEIRTQANNIISEEYALPGEIYAALVGTIQDSGWSFQIDVSVDSGNTFSGVTIATDYLSESLSTASAGLEFFSGNLAGAEIDHGVCTLSPGTPSSSEYTLAFPATLRGVTITAIPSFGGSSSIFSGQTIDKTKANWYLTDLGHPGAL